ncbi:MAG: hypothetical protein AAF495_23345 [Pseudomonadota bacterium]
MNTPVAERGRTVTFVTAAGLTIGLAIAFGILVLSLQGQGPAMISLAKSGAQDGLLVAAKTWSGVESFLGRVMYR